MEAVPDRVAGCLQLAILLEVSAYPKPGNVHRTADFDETRYEHFLASAVAVHPYFRSAAQRGIEVFQNKISIDQIGIGSTVRNLVSEIASWQHDKNTLLGSVLLLTPMAAAAGMALAKRGRVSVDVLKDFLVSIVKSTTSQDAIDVYDAISIARPGGLGKAPKLDVNDSKSRQRILSRGTSLYEVFKISSPWDSISAEWVNGFHITFDVGYPCLMHEIRETKDVNTASVNTFLRILSEVPDTLIARKAGKAKARWVSKEAKTVLDAGGLSTQKGRNRLTKLDRKLHDPGHKLNPGTTADITSAVLALAILQGHRP